MSGATIQLRFETPEEFIEQFRPWLALGGIFVPTRMPYPVDTDVTCDFRKGDGSQLLHGVGKVIWVRREDGGVSQPAGMAVRFRELDRESRDLVLQILEEQVKSGGEFFEIDQVPPGVETEAPAPESESDDEEFAAPWNALPAVPSDVLEPLDEDRAAAEAEKDSASDLGEARFGGTDSAFEVPDFEEAAGFDQPVFDATPEVDDDFTQAAEAVEELTRTPELAAPEEPSFELEEESEPDFSFDAEPAFDAEPDFDAAPDFDADLDFGGSVEEPPAFELETDPPSAAAATTLDFDAPTTPLHAPAVEERMASGAGSGAGAGDILGGLDDSQLGLGGSARPAAPAASLDSTASRMHGLDLGGGRGASAEQPPAVDDASLGSAAPADFGEPGGLFGSAGLGSLSEPEESFETAPPPPPPPVLAFDEVSSSAGNPDAADASEAAAAWAEHDEDAWDDDLETSGGGRFSGLAEAKGKIAAGLLVAVLAGGGWFFRDTLLGLVGMGGAPVANPSPRRPPPTTPGGAVAEAAAPALEADSGGEESIDEGLVDDAAPPEDRSPSDDRSPPDDPSPSEDQLAEAAAPPIVRPQPTPPPVSPPPSAVPPPPPVAETSAPPRSGARATRVTLMTTRESAEGTVVTVRFDGDLEDDQFVHDPMAWTDVKEQVLLSGIVEPYAEGQVQVGSASLDRVRAGYHPGNRLHLVFDLSSNRSFISSVSRPRADRLEITVRVR